MAKLTITKAHAVIAYDGPGYYVYRSIRDHPARMLTRTISWVKAQGEIDHGARYVYFGDEEICSDEEAYLLMGWWPREIELPGLRWRAWTGAYPDLAELCMTPAEAERATGLDETTWRDRAARGKIPGATKKGKQWLLPRVFVEQCLQG